MKLYNNLTPKQLSIIFILIAAVAGASNPIAAKYALAVMGPFTILNLRFLFATLFLLYPITKAKEFSFQQLKDLFPVAMFGALNPTLLFIALQFTQASFSALIYAGVPALSALYLYFFKQQKHDLTRIMGIALGLFGVGFTVLLPAFQTGFPEGAVFGNGLIFLASFAFLAYSLMSKQKQSQLNVTPLALTFYFSLVTFMISLPLAMFEIYSNGIDPNTSIIHISSGVYMGVVATGVFYLSYQYALKHASAITASLFTYLQPVFSILMAAIILGEVITWPFIFGGTLAVVGAAIAASNNGTKE